MTARREMEAVLEAILFVSTDPVPRERLLGVFDAGEQEEAAAALEAVVEKHRGADGSGLLLEEVAGGFRLATRPELNGWLRKFYESSGANKMSMAALETLAIIAYRQPVTGPEIQDLRSVSPTGVLKTLLEKRLIRIAGRKAVVGKPFLYATTREFLMHFGLRSLADLPPLEEFEEAFGEGTSLGGVLAATAVDSQQILPLDATDAADAGAAASLNGPGGVADVAEGPVESDREASLEAEIAALEEAESRRSVENDETDAGSLVEEEV